MVSSWAIGRSKAILSNSNYWAASQRCTEREREREKCHKRFGLLRSRCYYIYIILHLNFLWLLTFPEPGDICPSSVMDMSSKRGGTTAAKSMVCCTLAFFSLDDHYSSSQHPSSWILRQCSSNLVDTTAMNPNCNCHQNNVSVAQDAVTTHHFHHFWNKLSHMHGKHRCSCLWVLFDFGISRGLWLLLCFEGVGIALHSV